MIRAIAAILAVALGLVAALTAPAIAEPAGPTRAHMLTVIWCVSGDQGELCASRVLPMWLPDAAACRFAQSAALAEVRARIDGLIWEDAICSEVVKAAV